MFAPPVRAAAATLLASLVWASPARSALWKDATSGTIGDTAEWTNKVAVADVDGDGDLDLLLANGGGYASAGEPEPTRLWLNDGPGLPFRDGSAAAFSDGAHLARVVEVRDFDGDGNADVLVGTTYETQSQLYRGLGGGAFGNDTAVSLPAGALSVGDLAAGDVDGDGDLDVLLADWGPGSPLSNDGARTRLWLNDGLGHFTDVTETHTPNAWVRFSWDVELVDVDNDGDLDALISCKSCNGSRLFLNDGVGFFSDSAGLPKRGNNYDFEPMDLTGDGFVDLVTVNDGPGLRESLLVNDGYGSFTDLTETHFSGAANPGEDDNVAVMLDADSDGDADVLIGSLSGADRLLLNDGNGVLTLGEGVFDGPATPGTLGLAVGDLDSDGRLDVVEGQGEAALPDHVYLADGLTMDTAAPTLQLLTVAAEPGAAAITARIHDRKTPVRDSDFEAVSLEAVRGDQRITVRPTWVGEALWRGRLALEAGSWAVRACATDANGNAACSAARVVEVTAAPVAEGEAVVEAPTDADGGAEPAAVVEAAADAGSGAEDPADLAADAGPAATGDAKSGGCAAGGPPRPEGWAFGLFALALARRARYHARR